MALPPEDLDVLEQLRASGDCHAIERPVMHWFFGDEADLRIIGRRLCLPSWTDLEPREDEHGWLMSPTKQSALVEDAVLRMNAEISMAADGLDVTYDGWETSIEKAS